MGRRGRPRRLARRRSTRRRRRVPPGGTRRARRRLRRRRPLRRRQRRRHRQSACGRCTSRLRRTDRAGVAAWSCTARAGYRCAEHGRVRPGPRRRADLDAGRYEPPCPACGAPLAPVSSTRTRPPTPATCTPPPSSTRSTSPPRSAASTTSPSPPSATTTCTDPGCRATRPTPAWRHLPQRGRARRAAAGARGRRSAPRLRARHRRRPGQRGRRCTPPSPSTVRSTWRRASRARCSTWPPRWPRRGPTCAPEVVGGYRLGDVRHVVASPARAGVGDRVPRRPCRSTERHWRRSPPTRCAEADAGRAGGAAVKRQPVCSLRTAISPWCASTRPRAMARPSPPPTVVPGVRASSPR